MHLKDKTILLTGASKGIGLELSKQLANEGAKLILIGRSFSHDEIEGDHVYIEADINNENGLEKIAHTIDSYEIDALINMAGVGIYEKLDDLSLEELQNSLNINVLAPFFLIKQVYEKLKNSDLGLVLNIGSGAGTMPFSGRSAYCASKYALRGLSLSLSEEFGDDKPEFCLITLGSTMTTFGGKTMEEQEEKVKSGRAVFPTEYVAKELISIMKANNRESEVVLYPSEHGFGEWTKPKS